MTVEEYLALITTEHSGRPKYMAALGVTLEQIKVAADAMDQVGPAFDLDTAVGVQLDIIGIWVGRSRNIDVPLEGVYFTWGGTAATGWSSGVWQGDFDPDSGLVLLPDEDYRTLLRAKIAANRWDGSIPGAYEVWEGAFGDGNFLMIQDNQNMTMTVGIVGPALSAVTKALLSGGYIPLKPAGVRAEYIVSPDTGPLFAWGVDNGVTLAGWGTGRWGTEL